MPVSKLTVLGFRHRLQGNTRYICSPNELKHDYMLGWHIGEYSLQKYTQSVDDLSKKVKHKLIIMMAVISIVAFFLPYEAKTRLIVLGFTLSLTLYVARLYITLMKRVLLLSFENKFTEINGGLGE